MKKGQDFASLLALSRSHHHVQGQALGSGRWSLNVVAVCKAQRWNRGQIGDVAVVEGSPSPFVLLRAGFCALVLLPGSTCSFSSCCSKKSRCQCSSWRFFSASKILWLLSSALTGKRKKNKREFSSFVSCQCQVLNPASSCRAPYRRGRTFHASKGRNPSEIVSGDIF